jgi:hypothetical protein
MLEVRREVRGNVAGSLRENTANDRKTQAIIGTLSYLTNPRRCGDDAGKYVENLNLRHLTV